MHILIAPNAFKNSLDAIEVADAIADGLRASRFVGSLATCPVGDGGDGTAALLLRHLGGTQVPVVVQDPLGRAIQSHFVLADAGRTAIIELAAASGLRHLTVAELDPLRATSFGTGELMLAALDRGVQEIMLCVGGSATVDGGTGILRALGVRFLDQADNELSALPASMTTLTRIDLTRVDPRLEACELTILCDVTNPLLGARGAAAVFGPQKGATPAAVQSLESALGRFSEIVAAHTGNAIADLERGGAAGGVAAGLFGLLGANLVNGIDYFLTRIDFDAALAQADVVITGEGSIDDQTAEGKGPWGVAVKARERGAFVVGLAGQVPLLAGPVLRSCFDVLMPIGNRAMSVADAMNCTGANLRRAALDLGNLLAPRAPV
jgi:glycerate 2-kinase